MDLNFFNLWKEALIHPKETFKKEKANASLLKAIRNVGIAGLISGLFLGLFYSIILLLGGTSIFFPNIRDVNFLTLYSVTILILLPIFCIILILFESLVYFIFAKILGGKGKYTQQIYLMSLYWAPILIISTIVLILEFLHIAIYAITALVLLLYNLYLVTMALKETHEFSTIRAVLSWVIPLVILTIILISFIVFLAGLIFLQLGNI